MRVLCLRNCARLHEGEGDLTSALTKLVEVNEGMAAGMCWCLCLGVYWDTVYNMLAYGYVPARLNILVFVSDCAWEHGGVGTHLFGAAVDGG